jgi:hypothetical protein
MKKYSAAFSEAVLIVMFLTGCSGGGGAPSQLLYLDYTLLK